MTRNFFLWFNVLVCACVCVSLFYELVWAQGMRRMKMMQHRTSHNSTRQIDRNSSSSVSELNRTSQPSVILLWTTYWEDPKWELKSLGRRPMEGQNCPYNNCIFEMNQNNNQTTASAAMLLFSCADNLMHPPVRHPDQIYVFYCWEPPMIAPIPQFKNLHVNMTVTIRPDSDLAIPMGIFTDKQNPSPGLYVPKYPLKGKTKSVVWAVSNCRPSSKRDLYVAELAKHIDVDIYGNCGKLKCKRRAVSCFKQFEKEYKFYLSLENAICWGYTTEKLYSPMGYELVPVVLGGGNYSMIAPPHSYINVMDYKSPAELAKYLKFLSENESEYYKYFQWKQTKIALPNQPWCKLCEAATKRRSYHKEITPKDLSKWWLGVSCDNDWVTRHLAS